MAAFSMPPTLDLAIVQLRPRKGDYASNITRIGGLLARAAGLTPRPTIVQFPETAVTGYFVEGAVREATLSRRLGYRSKSLVLPEHAKRLKEVFTPGADEIAHARAIIVGFDAARSRGEDRALVDGLWVEVPTYRNARRLMERAHRLRALPNES